MREIIVEALIGDGLDSSLEDGVFQRVNVKQKPEAFHEYRLGVYYEIFVADIVSGDFIGQVVVNEGVRVLDVFSCFTYPLAPPLRKLLVQ